MSATNFGRRTAAKPAPAPLPAMTKFSRPAAVSARGAPSDPVADELRAWKKSRGPSPYLKPLALAASLCFGVASLALPAAVNDWVQYPLYALSAASLYADSGANTSPPPKHNLVTAPGTSKGPRQHPEQGMNCQHFMPGPANSAVPRGE